VLLSGDYWSPRFRRAATRTRRHRRQQDVPSPHYGVDGYAALNCIEQNVVGGFTEEEMNIIRDDPTATSWPPGLGEKYAAVLEECIPLEPWYLDSFSRYTWVDPACIQTMTDWVLARYNWVRLIQMESWATRNNARSFRWSSTPT